MFKRILSALFIGLILTMTLTTYSSARQAQQVREDVLRLHVLANSDSEADQALKLKVRDGVLDKARALFSEAGDRDAAYAIAARNTAALQQAATSSIRRPASSWPICRNTNAVETVCTTPHSQIPRSGTPVRAWSSRQRCLAFSTGAPSYSSIHSRMSTPRS